MREAHFFGKLWYAIWNFVFLFLISIFIGIACAMFFYVYATPNNTRGMFSVLVLVGMSLILVSIIITTIMTTNKYKPLSIPKSIIGFRLIVVFYLLLIIAIALINMIFPHSGLAHQGIIYQKWADENQKVLFSIYPIQVVIFRVAMFSIIINAISLYGIFHLSRIFRMLYIISLVVWFSLEYAFGPANITSNLNSLLETLSLIALGMIIMMMFTDPVKKYFAKKSEV